jgi:hypothetical protein
MAQRVYTGVYKTGHLNSAAFLTDLLSKDNCRLPRFRTEFVITDLRESPLSVGIGDSPVGADEVVHCGSAFHTVELVIYPLPNRLSHTGRTNLRDVAPTHNIGFEY